VVETATPPGTPGHGRGLTSIRRLAGRVTRSAETDEWVIPFEVICIDCGDTGGPFDEQPPQVQAVRGPYPDSAAARRALDRHTGRA
jgi:hypothetical protein